MSRHWSVTGNGDWTTIEVFGLKGMTERKIPCGAIAPPDETYNYYGEVAGALHQMDFSAVQVSGEITKAVRERQDEEIEYVVVSSRWAVCLWLERKIKFSDLRAAVEDDDSILLTLKFGGKEYQVVVVDESEVDYHLAFSFKEE